MSERGKVHYPESDVLTLELFSRLDFVILVSFKRFTNTISVHITIIALGYCNTDLSYSYIKNN